MTLDELIDELKKRDPDQSVMHGFGKGMSYRGYYHDAAFEPVMHTTIGEMLNHALNLLGTTQEGYKGGEYVMNGYVDVYIADYGSTGEEITSFNFLYWDN